MTQPASPSVNASPAPSRTPAHDSRSPWIATPSMQDVSMSLLQAGLSRRHPVRRIGHPEQTHTFPMIFRYLYAPHRTREVAPRGHPVPQFAEVVPPLLLEQADTDRVHARRALIGPDLL